MSKFIGRDKELERLIEISNKNIASFILIKGRRRIGKSRLVEEFGKKFKYFYVFSGIPPTEKITKQDQLDDFSLQISRNFGIAPAKYNDWNDAFWAISDNLKNGKILLFFDEISWMGSKDNSFLSKIKNFWDLYLKKHNKLVFIVCGSASAWIEKNILGNTGFVGRISSTITLKELPLIDCLKFWNQNITDHEKLKLLSITGGIPRYLEEVNPKLNAEHNITNLCFLDGGFLVREYEQIFSDIFLRNSIIYKKIIKALIGKSLELKELQNILKLDSQGRLSEYLWELEVAGFISRDFSWNLKNGRHNKFSKFRLKDNYLRFYLKYIEPNLEKIHRGLFEVKSYNILPGWNCILGLQFENLILNNRNKILEILNISLHDVLCDNPYFQRGTKNQKGCQIDYMIQTKFNTLYICEIKFSTNKIDTSIIEEMQNKIESISRYKKYSCRPVLIHVGGVTDNLNNSDFFAKIIHINDLN